MHKHTLHWLLLGLLSFTHGCVFPEEDVFLEDWKIKNRPLRIVESQVSPARLVTLEAGDPCRITFSAVVDDPDLTTDALPKAASESPERVDTRWFVTGSVRSEFIEGKFLDPNVLTAEYTLILNQAGSPISTPGLYSVDLRVTDGQFSDGTLLSGSEPEKLDNGLEDTTYVDGYSWTVNLTTDVANCVDTPGVPAP